MLLMFRAAGIPLEGPYELWRHLQAGQLTRLLQEGAGEEENGVLLCGVDTRRSKQGGQVKGKTNV